MTRDAALQIFADTLGGALGDARLAAAPREAVRRIFGALATPGGEGAAPADLPACEWLPPTLARAEGAGGPVAHVAAAFAALLPHLCWRRRAGNSTASASFADGHANAMIFGPGGMETRSDVWIGASLLAPDVRYPDHTHPPEEVYYLLSPGEFRQEEGEWFAPGIGGTLYNRPGILHAMRTHDAPMLALWSLWTGAA